jgi:transposase InsO family protein
VIGTVEPGWDNAVAESFFAPLETELLVDLRGRDREEVQQEVFRYVEGNYNRRLHSTLGYLTPVEYEERFHQVGATPPSTNTSEAEAA